MKQTADEILQKHEDANEMHFHQVDRQWIIQAMEEYATVKSEKPINLEISDEEIEEYAKRNAFQYYEFITGAKWYKEQLKNKL